MSRVAYSGASRNAKPRRDRPRSAATESVGASGCDGAHCCRGRNLAAEEISECTLGTRSGNTGDCAVGGCGEVPGGLLTGSASRTVNAKRLSISETVAQDFLPDVVEDNALRSQGVSQKLRRHCGTVGVCGNDSVQEPPSATRDVHLEV